MLMPLFCKVHTLEHLRQVVGLDQAVCSVVVGIQRRSYPYSSKCPFSVAVTLLRKVVPFSKRTAHASIP